MRKRTAFGGLVVVGILIGGFLAGLFPSFGTGDGSGEGTGRDTLVSVEPSGPTDVVPPRPDIIEDDSDEPPDPQSGELPRVLHVVIDDRSYALRRTKEDGSTEEQPIELAKLIELANSVPGDEDGVRVRIHRKQSARATAERDLEEALAAAGLDQNSVYWQE